MTTQPRPGPTVRATPLVVTDGTARPRSDVLVAEEPLEIRVNAHGADHQISVTMRTPANDFELAVGFLYSEGIIRNRDEMDQVRYCVGGPVEQQYNIVTVALRPGVAFDAESLKRNFYTTSSCGICGKASLEALALNTPPPIPDGPVVDASLIAALPEKLRRAQKVFERTGGLHAAGLFEADGTLVVVREDVGRHNAVDKLVGWLVMEGKVPAGERILLVSGRASFEIMQKALAAGIPIVAAVSAPSSLAVATAEEFGLTLAGFVRGDTLNVYAGKERIRVTADQPTETGKAMTDDPKTPQEIWALIERADERVKYASNRDEKAAYGQARELLEQAATAAKTIAGAEKLAEQAQIRLEDLAKLESA